AGVIWAAFLPLLIYGLLRIKERRVLMVAGVISACVIIALTASSTPALGAVTAVIGMALFPLRRYARYGFIGLGLLLVLLHIVMEAPVWHLIVRINVTGGNSGWHRFVLIDGFIKHWNEWWFLGTRMGTAH